MVIDSSSLISLSRAGLLPLLNLLSEPPIVADVVEREAATEGVEGRYPDATAISNAIREFPRRKTKRSIPPDAAILALAKEQGTLVCNDLALGRRARNLGVIWLRTADVILFLVRSGRLESAQGRQAIVSLQSARRIGEDLAAEYLEELK